MSSSPPSAWSRRSLAQLLAAGVAGLALDPWIGEAAAPAVQKSQGELPPPPVRPRPAPGIVRLSSNENPAGPSPQAMAAIRDSMGLLWRYPDEHLDDLVTGVAALNRVQADQIVIGAGSSEILKIAVAACTSANRGLVMAAPTFESVAHHAQRAGSEVFSVPLTADFRHDLGRMLAATRTPGLFYICNPNNPTASVTPKDELRAFLDQVPPQSFVLVDEAYFHFAEDPRYESVIPLVAAHPQLIVARTFSKIYGMAGLRCGYGVGQAATMTALRNQTAFDSVNVLAAVAAIASLADPGYVDLGRQRNRDLRAKTVGEVEKMGFTTIPSSANFIMIDVRRPVGPVRAALRGKGVEVGRTFPALPNHLRVTIGLADQMDAFLTAFRAVMA
jgi:histidinol-phosphate aminotransferase